MLKMYAIPNCDTVKKARKWLEANGVAYEFYDYKKAGVPEDKLRAWVKAQGWEVICNQRGMTWRKLSDAEKAAINNADAAIDFMLEKSSVIKRPIIEGASELVIGFDEDTYARVFL
ncbi:MAG: ArsC family reductase [Rickettsiales bacterium]